MFSQRHSHVRFSRRTGLLARLIVLVTLLLVAAPVGAAPAAQGPAGTPGQGRGRRQVQLAPVAPPSMPSHRQPTVRGPKGGPASGGAASQPGAGAAPAAAGGGAGTLAAAPAAAGGGAGTLAAAPAAANNYTVDMKVLLISAVGEAKDEYGSYIDPDFVGYEAFLRQIGIPFDTLIASQTPLTAAMLSDGALHAYYQGIILTTGSLYYQVSPGNFVSAFDQTQWQMLWDYEAKYRVRQMTSFTAPGQSYPENYGLNYAGEGDTTTTPLQATLTVTGTQIYSYLNTSSPITFKNAYAYYGTVISPSATTPLLVGSNNAVIASITTYPSGRQNLAVTIANNPYLVHSMLLSYGNINWLTKGVFLGERHVYFAPQNDDLLDDDNIWDTTAMTDTTGLSYRMSGSDFSALINWQKALRNTSSNLNQITVEWAFVGAGATGLYSPDTLTPAVKRNQGQFRWINHTYTHPDLDEISYADALAELNNNNNIALNTLKLTKYFKDAFVQPSISGLQNPAFLQAAVDYGLKYLISDTSRTGWNNPSPNAGFYSTYQPSLLIIPRRPTNLFYNLVTPAQWVSEYNCFYGPNATCGGGKWKFWDHDLTYNEILDKESDMMLQYLLKWDIDPLMFHQSNTGAYDGSNTLMGDLINATMNKYRSAYNLPIRGLAEHDLGIKMAGRMTYDASGVTASVTSCTSMTVTVTQPATIPVTGANTGSSVENYGGQKISYLTLAANQSVTFSIPSICK